MRLLILIFIIVLGNFQAVSQGWIRLYGGSGDEYAAGLTIVGNEYVHLATTNSYGSGGTDILVIKTDSLGNLIWQQVIGTSAAEEAKGIISTPSGDLIIAGETNIAGNQDVYLVKLDINGEIIWTTSFPTAINEDVSGIAISDSCIGITSTIPAGQYSDIRAIGIDTSGNQLWSGTYGLSNHYEQSYSIAPVHDGGFIIAGAQSPIGQGYGYAVRIDAEGDSLWTKTITGFTNLIFFDCTELQGDSLFAFCGSRNAMVMRLDGTMGYSDNINNWGYSGITACSDGGFAMASIDCEFSKYSYNAVEIWTHGSHCGSGMIEQTADGGFLLYGEGNYGSMPVASQLIKTDQNGFYHLYMVNAVGIGTNLVSCPGDTLTFKVPSGFDDYQWYSGSYTSQYGFGLLQGETDSILSVQAVYQYQSYYCVMHLDGEEIISTGAGAYIFNQVLAPEIYPPGPVNFCAASDTITLSTSNNGYDFQWYLNGVVIPGANTNIYSPTVSGSYSVLVNNNCDTVESAPVMVNANAPPDVTLNPNSVTTKLIAPFNMLCDYDGPFVASSNWMATSYTWLYNGTPVGNNTNTLDPVNNGNYQVIATNACGSDTATGYSSIITLTYDIYFTGQVSGCGTDSVLLEVYNSYSDYQWYLYGNPIPGATLPSYMATISGAYTCSFTVYCNQGGGTAFTNPVTVTINTTPEPYIYPTGNTVVCSGSVLLNASQAGATYQWYRNSLSIPGATAQTYLADSSGAYKCHITSAACGTVISDLIYVKIGAPSGTISCSNPVICQGSSVGINLQGDNISTLISRQWRKDGILIPGAINTQYYASTQGNYDCMLVNLCDTFYTNVITTSVFTLPGITPGGPVEICSGDSIVLSAPTGTGYTYMWYANSFIISGATGSSYNAINSALYKVRVNTGSCSIMSPEVMVSVNNRPIANIWSSTYPAICVNDSVWLHANNNPGYNVDWFLNGSPHASGVSDLYATAGGDYSIYILDSNGCDDSSPEFYISANTLPPFVVQANDPAPYCTGDTVTMTALISANNYQWYVNGTLIPGATTPTLTANQSGLYTISIADTQGCNATAIQNIYFNVPPQLSFTTQPSQCGNSNGSISTSYAGGNSANNYLWSNGATTPSIFNLTSNIYYLTATDVYGCTSIDSVVVPSISYLLVDAVATNDSLCSGDSTQVSVNGPAGSTYIWNTGNSSSSFTTSIAGLYSVTVTDSTGCEGTDSVLVTDASINVAITASGTLSFCVGDSVVLDAGSGYNSYQWLRNGMPISMQISQTYAAKTSGRYSCVATNTANCIDTSTALMVRVICIPPPDEEEKILQSSDDLQISIFPNPVKDILNVKFEYNYAEDFADIVITDIAGKQILIEEITCHKGENEYSIFLDNYAPGLYFFTFVSNSVSVNRKIVLE